MRSYYHFIKKNLTDVFIIALIAGFMLSLMRIQESYFLETSLYDRYDAYRLLMQTSYVDIRASLVFSVFLLPFLFLKKGFRIVATIFHILFIVANSLLTKYFFTNFDALGDELLKFKFSEFMFVVHAEKVSMSTFDIVLFYFYPIAFLILVVVFYLVFNNIKEKFKTILVLSFVGFLLFSAIDYKNYMPDYDDFDTYQNYTLHKNKLSYFISESVSRSFRNSEPIEFEDIDKRIEDYHKSRPEFNYYDNEFPFMHNEKYTNTLGPFFEKMDTSPNIVFVLVESLSSSFSGPNAHLGSYTPFLDSLKNESLYWSNFLSNAERTYGVLPNVLSSAPYFNQFVSNEIYPTHTSIIQELQKQSYFTDYHYGGWEDFSSRGRFVRSCEIDELYADHSFDTTLFKQPNKEDNDAHWGYDDKDLFEQYFLHTEEIQEPFLSILLTLSMHSPYITKEDYTMEDVKRYLGDDLTDYQKNLMAVHPKKIKAISFSDEYLKTFFEVYKKKKEFKNTIFVILGDHNIHSLPVRNEIDLFHVPMMIYSELLKEPKVFKGVSTHREIIPSLFGLLENNFNIEFDENKHWLGGELDTSSVFNSDISTPMCMKSTKYINYIYKDNLVFKNDVYQFDSLLNIHKQEDTLVRNKVLKLFEDYVLIEEYMMKNNSLFPKE